MAKKIFDTEGVVTGFEPGCIYELRFNHEGVDIPFYVGETTDWERRWAEHIYGAKTATADSETKYQFIATALDANNIPWILHPVVNYGAEGPVALEDEHMMELLVDGYELTNEKKGNAAWMMERLAVAEDMRERNIRSFKEYKDIIADEASESGSDHRTPEQRAQLVKLMTMIKGSAAEALAWTIKHEKKMARLEKAAREREADQFVGRLQGIAQETIKLTYQFPIEEQIKIMQGLVLTYTRDNATPELLQTAQERLTELQELAK